MVIPRPVGCLRGGSGGAPRLWTVSLGLLGKLSFERGRKNGPSFRTAFGRSWFGFLLCRRRRRVFKAAVGPFFRRMGLAAEVASGLVVGRWPPRLGQAGLQLFAKRAKA
jgi:hypothetical protein